jgi:hypothetical protein
MKCCKITMGWLFYVPCLHSQTCLTFSGVTYQVGRLLCLLSTAVSCLMAPFPASFRILDAIAHRNLPCPWPLQTLSDTCMLLCLHQFPFCHCLCWIPNCGPLPSVNHATFSASFFPLFSMSATFLPHSLPAPNLCFLLPVHCWLFIACPDCILASVHSGMLFCSPFLFLAPAPVFPCPLLLIVLLNVFVVLLSCSVPAKAEHESG